MKSKLTDRLWVPGRRKPHRSSVVLSDSTELDVYTGPVEAPAPTGPTFSSGRLANWVAPTEPMKRIRFGLGAGNKVVWVDNGPSGAPFGLVIAPPGTGKTSCARVIARQYFEAGYHVHCYDAKGEGLLWVREFIDPRYATVCLHPDEIAEDLAELSVRVETWSQTPYHQREPMLEAIVFDEVPYTYATWEMELGKSPAPIKNLARLVGIGRSIGIRGNLMALRPDASILEGPFRALFDYWVVAGTLGPDASKMACGTTELCAPPRGKLPKKPGRGAVVLNNSDVTHCQLYWLPDPLLDPRALEHFTPWLKKDDEAMGNGHHGPYKPTSGPPTTGGNSGFVTIETRP